jgi:hypothetical protein
MTEKIIKIAIKSDVDGKAHSDTVLILTKQIEQEEETTVASLKAEIASLESEKIRVLGQYDAQTAACDTKIDLYKARLRAIAEAIPDLDEVDK